MTGDGEVLGRRHGGFPVVPRLLLFLGVGVVMLAVLGWVVPGGVTGSAASLLAASLVAGWVTLAVDGLGPGALGFGLRAGVPREVLLGGVLGAALLVPVVAILLVGGGVAFSSDGGSVGRWFAEGAGSLAFLALPAASEEALVRGYPLQAMTRAWGPGWALALTSGLFGLAHLGNPGSDALGAVNVAVAGVFLGVLVLRTGSLWWATGAHLGWNWGQGFLADLPVSGLDVVDTPLVGAELLGPDWLSGGAFGVEGSVLTALVMGGAAWLCWRSPRVAAEGPRWWRGSERDERGGDAAEDDGNREEPA